MAEEPCEYENSTTYSSQEKMYSEVLFPCVALFVVAAIGLLGNVLTMFAVAKKNFRHLSFSIYLRALTLHDSLTLFLTAVPHLLEWIYRTNMASITGIAGFLGFHFCTHSVQMTASWLMVAISVDRFIVVVFPLKRSEMCTTSRAKVTSIAIAFGTMLFMAAEILTKLLSINPNCSSEDADLDEFQSITNMRRVLLTLVIPGMVSLILNIKVFIVIRRVFSNRSQLSACAVQTEGANLCQLRITLALTIVNAVSAILFTPVIILNIVDAVQVEQHIFGKQLLNRICVAELIYIIDITLHFYMLIIISYGYTEMCFLTIKRLKEKLLDALTFLKPHRRQCYDIQSEMAIHNQMLVQEQYRMTINHL